MSKLNTWFLLSLFAVTVFLPELALANQSIGMTLCAVV